MMRRKLGNLGRGLAQAGPLFGLLLAACLRASAAEPTAEAVAGFNSYVRVVEIRLARQHTSRDGFLAPGGPASANDTQLRGGELIIEHLTPSAGAELPEEKALIGALDAAEPKASAAIEKEDFTAAMSALASLRAPIDSFFDHVTVNDPDAAKREQRLNLLMRFRDAVNRVADFSRIEG